MTPAPPPPPPAVAVEPPPAPSQAAAAAIPKPGDFVAPTPPSAIPSALPDIRLDLPAISDADVSGVGIRGDVIGTPPAGDERRPTGAPAEGPVPLDAVEVRPSLRNGDEIDRLVRRLYPSRLRDSGVTGEVALRFVIDAEGRVEPGSIEVVSASHPAFGEAARRAAERFRFTPASVGGRGVRVATTMPIRWTLER